MPLYTYATLAQASTDLAARLYDATGQFWTDAERQAYLIESLRSWNAHANFWRSDFSFNTRSGVTWYDFTDATNLPNSLRLLTVTDQSIYSMIEYHLLEPQTSTYPLTWSGSTQFSLADIIAAVQRRRDEILSITGCTISRRIVPASPGRTVLPDIVLDIRRLAWLPNIVGQSTYTAVPITQDDNYALMSFDQGYTVAEPGEPGVYMQSAQPPLTFDVDVPPAVVGQYELLTIEAGPTLSASTASTLLIPDDWTWLIKWGALADLLSRESIAKDIPRAKYCELRYRQGLAILLNAPSLLTMRLNNIPLEVTAVRDQDLYKPTWQAQAAGAPTVALCAGLNLVALSVTPDAGPYGLVASVVENAPIPTSPTDYIQLGRDDYDVLLDEAQHLAAFKMGGIEFLATLPLHARFMQQAAIYNQKLLTYGGMTDAMLALSHMEDMVNPRLESTEAVTGG